MFEPKFFQEIAQKVAEKLPPKFNEVRSDVERTVQSLLNQTFTKLDLITKEEFEVQTEVLKRTREKLEQLEKTVKQLEKQINKK